MGKYELLMMVPIDFNFAYNTNPDDFTPFNMNNKFGACSAVLIGLQGQPIKSRRRKCCVYGSEFVWTYKLIYSQSVTDAV